MSPRGRHVIRPRRRRRLVVGAITAVVLPALLVAAVVLRMLNNVSTVEVETIQASEPDGPLNVLLIGSDARSAGGGRYGDDDGTGRSDSMVLAHLSAQNDRIDAVQIPRDLMMEVPACEDAGWPGGMLMINATFDFGPSCAHRAVEAVTGVPIHHLVVLDFDGFEQMVDALGGIDVCLDEPVRDQWSMADLPAGPQKLNGEQALALARTRHAFGDGSDIARMENQQRVMSAIAQQATSEGLLTRPDRLVRFLNAVTSSLTVDDALGSPGELVSLASRVASVPLSAITFQVMPWQPASFDPNRVEMTDEARELFAALRDDVSPDAAAESPDEESPAAPDDPQQDAAAPEPVAPPAERRSADVPLC
ncbi:LCP family protein [Aeromicrobium camelliae]|nr:LCP family protein [Aeromicrobium camelliae]